MSITDSEIQSFVRTFMHETYRGRKAPDERFIQAFMQAILKRIVDEQITAIECLGGLQGWTRDSLRTLMSDAAEIELTQILGVFREAVEAESALA